MTGETTEGLSKMLFLFCSCQLSTLSSDCCCFSFYYMNGCLIIQYKMLKSQKLDSFCTTQGRYAKYKICIVCCILFTLRTFSRRCKARCPNMSQFKYDSYSLPTLCPQRAVPALQCYFFPFPWLFSFKRSLDVHILF